MALAPKSVRDVIENPPPPVQSWIETKILPHNATLMMGGESGIGKSFISLEFQRALTTGTPLFRDPSFPVPHPCRVLYCEQEIGEVSLADRFSDTFSSHRPSEYSDRAHYISQEPGLLLCDDAKHREMFELLRDLKINVCILDPLSHFHEVDENSNTEMGEIFRRINILKKACASQGLSFILTHHFKKAPIGHQDGYDILSADNFRGSSRNLADPDTVITVARIKNSDFSKPDPNGGPKFRGWKNKIGFPKLRHGEAPSPLIMEILPKGRHIVTITARNVKI